MVGAVMAQINITDEASDTEHEGGGGPIARIVDDMAQSVHFAERNVAVLGAELASDPTARSDARQAD